MDMLATSIEHLKSAISALKPLLQDAYVDRHEKADIQSHIWEIERLIEYFEHCIEVGFIDY